MKKLWVLFGGLLLAATVLAGQSFDEGIEYQVLGSPQPTNSDKIEVIEFFWYGCPHCYHLEPQLDEWVRKLPEDVEFIRVPAVLGPSWELLARAYYTARFLGVLDKVHRPLFDAIHQHDRKFHSVDDLAAFFAEHGVAEADFRKTFKSFAVVVRTNQSKQARERYGLTGVPTLVVNGKYRTSATLTGSNEKMLDVVDYLIQRERSGTASRAAAH